MLVLNPGSNKWKHYKTMISQTYQSNNIAAKKIFLDSNDIVHSLQTLFPLQIRIPPEFQSRCFVANANIRTAL